MKYALLTCGMNVCPAFLISMSARTPGPDNPFGSTQNTPVKNKIVLQFVASPIISFKMNVIPAENDEKILI